MVWLALRWQCSEFQQDWFGFPRSQQGTETQSRLFLRALTMHECNSLPVVGHDFLLKNTSVTSVMT